MWVIAYVIFRVNPELSPPQFNLLYWMFMLIVSINIALRTEHHQGEEEHLMMYTLISPINVFFSRLIFNVMYLSFVGLAFYVAMILLFFPLIKFDASFLRLIVLGALGIAGALSFISAIARYGAGQNTVLSVLSIPVLIPVILLLYGLGTSSMMGNSIEAAQYIAILSISFISIALSMVLFPYVWRQ